MAKYITLVSRYEVRGEPEKVIVDDDDYPWLSKFRWCNNNGYAVHVMRADNKPVKIRMHRMIMGVSDSKTLVDHIDGNRLNNQKSNLRIADGSLNSHNRKDEKNRVKLGVFRGVHYNQARNKYEVTVTKDYKKMHLGRYDDILEAALAYDEKITAIYGDNAMTNFKIIEELYLSLKNKLTNKK